MKIYVASSWRTERHPAVVQALRDAGHDVYDYRDEGKSQAGFDMEHDYDLRELEELLQDIEVETVLYRDMGYLNDADAVVLVLPSGRSSHWEAGYAQGVGTPTYLVWEPREPEFIYGTFHAVTDDIAELIACLYEDFPNKAGTPDDMLSKDA